MKNSSLYQLSLWARKNPNAARWIIGTNRVVTACLAFFAGAYLAVINGIHLKEAIHISACACVLAYIYYPLRNEKRKPLARFYRRKYCDGLLVISACLFWLCAGNTLVFWEPLPATAPLLPVTVMQSAIAKSNEAIYPAKAEAKVLKKVKRKGNAFFKKLKTRTHRFLKKIKAKTIAAAKAVKRFFQELDDGTVVLLIFLSVLIAGLLGYLTLAYSCSLSCSGQDGAAAMVGVFGLLGTAGIISLIWYAAKHSSRQKTHKD
ncbi:MAG: hypothetical protein AAFZ15_29960 [Bacteroidota bacterium]